MYKVVLQYDIFLYKVLMGGLGHNIILLIYLTVKRLISF